MSPSLTTHVLDTANGKPAAGMRIDVHRATQGQEALIRTVVTDENGRTQKPLLEKKELLPGSYILIFYVEDYFDSIDHPDAGRFLNKVPIAFVIEDSDQKYHVPLLVSPWSYSTYRGS